MNGIDYISITKHFDRKVTPISAHGQKNLIETGISHGKYRYVLKGVHGFYVDVWWNADGSAMGVAGSIMYYYQGHNLIFDKRQFYEAVEHIGTLLGVSLWDAWMNTFEFGAIMDIEGRPCDYIRNHHAAPGEGLTQSKNEKYHDHFTMWDDARGKKQLKMYDPDKNAKNKQPKEVRQQLQNEGTYNFNASHIKWEARYLKPEYMNKGAALRLEELMTERWQEVLKEDIYIQYQRIVPMKSIELPTSKKNLTTADIVTLALAEGGLNNGSTIDELKRMLYDKINSIPDELLNDGDKKARKRQVKALLDKLKEEPESRWDLTPRLEEALKG